MPRYVDVSVQQIQSYLVRAQHLKGRRGASTMITRATSKGAVTQCLAGLAASLHGEAGAVDGVIAVRLDEPEAVLTDEVTGRLVAHLRSTLPAAFLVSTYRDGASYADAVASDTDERRIARHLPVCAEWPAAKRCDWCNIWPASSGIIDGAGQDARHREVCRDCVLRSDAAAAAPRRAGSHSPKPGCTATSGTVPAPDRPASCQPTSSSSGASDRSPASTITWPPSSPMGMRLAS